MGEKVVCNEQKNNHIYMNIFIFDTLLNIYFYLYQCENNY